MSHALHRSPRWNFTPAIVGLLAGGVALCALPTPVHAQVATPEIVGGSVAKPGKWPFVVSLVYRNTSSNLDAAFCGATLISPRDVLTAAHCLGETKKVDIRNMQLLVGTQDLSTGGRRVEIQSATRHPSFDPVSYDSDVAVLRLKAPITDIKPVAYIDSSEAEQQYASPGTKAKTLGWGNTSSDDGPGVWPSQLMQVNVPLMTNAACQGFSGFEGVTERMLCAGYKKGGKDACQGDSGGPLFVFDKPGKRYLQAGIVSWGYGCAQPKEPGVYARVSQFGPWIKAQIAKP